MSEPKKKHQSVSVKMAAGILLIGLLVACGPRHNQTPPAPLMPDCPPYPTEKIAGWSLGIRAFRRTWHPATPTLSNWKKDC
jgi:hypothetical protein